MFNKIGKNETNGKKALIYLNKRLIFTALKIILFGLVAGFLFEYLGAKGLVGLVLLFIIYGLYKCWVARDTIISVMKYIEGSLWGKPLDKDLWSKEEWKNRKKVKIVWKKKNL